MKLFRKLSALLGLRVLFLICSLSGADDLTIYQKSEFKRYFQMSDEALEADKNVRIHQSFRHRVFSVKVNDQRWILKRALAPEKKPPIIKASMRGNELVESFNVFKKIKAYKRKENIKYFHVVDTYKVRYKEDGQGESDKNTGIVQPYCSHPNLLDFFKVLHVDKNQLTWREKIRVKKIKKKLDTHCYLNFKRPHPHNDTLACGYIKAIQKVNAYLKSYEEELNLKKEDTFLTDEEAIHLLEKRIVRKGDFYLCFKMDASEGQNSIEIAYGMYTTLNMFHVRDFKALGNYQKMIQKDAIQKVSLHHPDVFMEWLKMVKALKLTDLRMQNIKINKEKDKMFIFDLEPIYAIHPSNEAKLTAEEDEESDKIEINSVVATMFQTFMSTPYMGLKISENLLSQQGKNLSFDAQDLLAKYEKVKGELKNLYKESDEVINKINRPVYLLQKKGYRDTLAKLFDTKAENEKKQAQEKYIQGISIGLLILSILLIGFNLIKGKEHFVNRQKLKTKKKEVKTKKKVVPKAKQSPSKN